MLSTLPHSTLEDIVFGIKHCVRYVKDNPREINIDKDYTKGHSTIKLRPTRETSVGQNREYRVSDYAPYVFADIRNLLGAPPDLFLKSFGEPSTEEEMTISTAKSGSYFYKTKDEKYFIKTLHYPELTALLGLLYDYHQHLKLYPNTFIVRIYGIWRIKDYGRDNLWVIVMRNVFPPGVNMDTVLDLKGRKPKSNKYSENQFKSDYEYTKILFHEEDKQFYQTQLKRDVDLLKSHNLMDYSLLIGVHNATEGDQTTLQTSMEYPNFFLRGYSLVSTDGGTVGFTSKPYQFIWINIIDILTVYNTQKKIANLFKTTLYSRESISTVDSEFYATRFVSFLTQNLLSVGEGSPGKINNGDSSEDGNIT